MQVTHATWPPVHPPPIELTTNRKRAANGSALALPRTKVSVRAKMHVPLLRIPRVFLRIRLRPRARIFGSMEMRRQPKLPGLLRRPMVRRRIVFTRGGARPRVVASAKVRRLAEVLVFHLQVSVIFFLTFFFFQLAQHLLTILNNYYSL